VKVWFKCGDIILNLLAFDEFHIEKRFYSNSHTQWTIIASNINIPDFKCIGIFKNEEDAQECLIDIYDMLQNSFCKISKQDQITSALFEAYEESKERD
jgi:hypothetical protein